MRGRHSNSQFVPRCFLPVYNDTGVPHTYFFRTAGRVHPKPRLFFLKSKNVIQTKENSHLGTGGCVAQSATHLFLTCLRTRMNKINTHALMATFDLYQAGFKSSTTHRFRSFKTHSTPLALNSCRHSALHPAHLRRGTAKGPHKGNQRLMTQKENRKKKHKKNINPWNPRDAHVWASTSCEHTHSSQIPGERRVV